MYSSSNRIMAAETEDEKNITLDELRDYFECPICLMPPRRPPIHQCVKGHLICSECRPQIAQCPVCRSKLSNNRLLFAEKLMEDRLPVPCKFANSGCNKEHVAARIKQHEERCPYRPVICPNASSGCRQRPTAASVSSHATLDCRFRSVKCPVSSCQDEIPQARVEEHLKREHFANKNNNNYNLTAVFLVLLIASLVTNWILYFHLMP